MYKTTASAAQLWRKTDVIKKDVDPKALVAFDVLNEAAKK
jgi:hypothetical protein